MSGNSVTSSARQGIQTTKIVIGKNDPTPSQLAKRKAELQAAGVISTPPTPGKLLPDDVKIGIPKKPKKIKVKYTKEQWEAYLAADRRLRENHKQITKALNDAIKGTE